MASGKLPLVYMQNSGLGNTVNPLLSLADEKVYSLPILLMVGWRGEPGTKDEPQHKKQGEVTLDLLEAMKIPYIILDMDEDEALAQIHEVIVSAYEKSVPHAIVVRKDTFDKYKLQKKQNNVYPLSREDALKLVIDHLHETDIVVSTTGKLSRELFEYREVKGHGHSRDFLTVGSMGHSSSIALGIALKHPERKVYCLDGDGAFIMHMGYQLKEGVGKKPSFGLKSGVYILMQKGGYHPMSWGNISTGGGFSMDYEKTNVESTRYYLQLPVMAHWGFKLCDDVRLKLAVGPYVAVGIGGRTNAYVSSSKYNIDEETGVGQYEYRNDYYRFGTFKGKTVNEEFGFEASPRLDWGGTASVGIAVKRISFTIGYDLAWGKYNKEQNDLRIRNHMVSFTSGYSF